MSRAIDKLQAAQKHAMAIRQGGRLSLFGGNPAASRRHAQSLVSTGLPKLVSHGIGSGDVSWHAAGIRHRGCSEIRPRSVDRGTVNRPSR